MELKTVIYEKKGNLAIIKFNRPHTLNAVNREFVVDLMAALMAAEKDKEVRVIIMKGEGRAFSSGTDVKEAQATPTLEEEAETTALVQDSTRLMLKSSKPILAAVHGYALGAGCEYCMLADIRIAAEDAKFGFPETSRGGPVTNAGTKILPQLVGMGKAKELIFTAEMIDAREAERIGLVNKVVPPEELDSAVMDMAQRIAGNYPLVLAQMKHALDYGLDMDYEATLQYEANAGSICFASGQYKEGMASALKKK